MKTKQLLLLAGAGALAYYFLVYKKEQNGSSAFSNAAGSCKPPKFYCAALKRCVKSTTRCDKAIDRKWN
tara:strand:- start:11126 stop:11332 length:207 start_codon:yes stop_codon:yes gene_type:complete